MSVANPSPEALDNMFPLILSVFKYSPAQIETHFKMMMVGVGASLAIGFVALLLTILDGQYAVEKRSQCTGYRISYGIFASSLLWVIFGYYPIICLLWAAGVFLIGLFFYGLYQMVSVCNSCKECKEKPKHVRN